MSKLTGLTRARKLINNTLDRAEIYANRPTLGVMNALTNLIDNIIEDCDNRMAKERDFVNTLVYKNAFLRQAKDAPVARLPVFARMDREITILKAKVAKYEKRT